MIPDAEQILHDDARAVEPWLESLAVIDPPAAHANLVRIAKSGVTPDLMEVICEQLAQELPKLADPDMAINNLERYIAAARSPLSVAAFLERDRGSLPTLLQIFAASQYLSDLLIRDPESYDLLRATGGRPVAREHLIDEIVSEVDALADRDLVSDALRRFKQRETLRIAYGDIVLDQAVGTVTRQISYLADALVEAAYRFGRRALEQKFGAPRGAEGEIAKFVVLALGKLGGMELNYSSDIDLILLFDVDGQTDGSRSISNQEFFDQLGRYIVKLLSEPTELGTAYPRVDLRLRPEGSRGPVSCSASYAQAYYDGKGRTWERQAYVKARPIAGDIEMGRAFLESIDSWIYRRFLSRADITGIKTLKRRIEKRSVREGTDERNVKVGHGGIRDIEFVIQFLQLLNAGDAPNLRTGNTIEAIHRLAAEGCLTHDEAAKLEPNYQMLRKLEHRLQIMFDLSQHNLPETEEGLRKVAIRMGYKGTGDLSPRESFERDLARRTRENRSILERLLHDIFGDESDTAPEVDLVNDPDPTDEQIERVLAPYGFANVPAAYENLMALAREPNRFLSTRRARHFLAAIAPRLLAKISHAPDPDGALVTLSRVSDSLGGKSALWELFSANPASLNLFVTLCATCPYLVAILTSHPGMIDELMDSLVLETLPTPAALEAELEVVSAGAEDIEPALHSFKNAQHLRVGIRDILGKDDIQATHRALANVAEACVRRIARFEYENLIEKFGVPTIASIDDEDSAVLPPDPALRHRAGEPCELIILALGKVGGREPNYHSDLDLVFLYEAEGKTVPVGRSSETTTNGHFFAELGQRVIRTASRLGPLGRLFEVDMRLRPTGKSGSLAVPVAAFERYFEEGEGQLWERQALCKARVIQGSVDAAERAKRAVENAAYGPKWRPEFADEIREMRHKLESGASKRNLKRGPGGTVDTEFLAQMLMLKFGGADPSVRLPGTLRSIDALREGGYLTSDDADYFARSYRFQRSVEARIRLMDSSGRHELPEDATELGKLAYLMGYEDPNRLEREALDYFAENRKRFDRIFDAAGK